MALWINFNFILFIFGPFGWRVYRPLTYTNNFDYYDNWDGRQKSVMMATISYFVWVHGEETNVKSTRPSVQFVIHHTWDCLGKWRAGPSVCSPPGTTVSRNGFASVTALEDEMAWKCHDERGHKGSNFQFGSVTPLTTPTQSSFQFTKLHLVIGKHLWSHTIFRHTYTVELTVAWWGQCGTKTHESIKYLFKILIMPSGWQPENTLGI